jgi:DNA-directed RNA polymerase specialized sigma24 family protein
VLDSPSGVVRALVTYTDWWQPGSGSVIQVGNARRSSNEFGDGMRAGLVDSLDERSELCRRMGRIEDRDRRILFLWYVRQLAADEIARDVGISRRQCFRRRSSAVRAIATSNPHGGDAAAVA